MEFFMKTKAVRLRSHLDKYLIADEDQQTVRQSRKGTSRRSKWTVEPVAGTTNLIRLKSCFGNYLTAADLPFLLGMTGKKVLQSPAPETTGKLGPAVDWEPERDGFQVKLRARSSGKLLRANGGMPPWRNSVTHDVPHTGSTHNWVLWDVDSIDLSADGDDDDGSSTAEDLESRLSSFSYLSSSEDVLLDSPKSPWSMASTKSPRIYSLPHQSGMEFFNNAKAVRLRSHHDKYLLADEDEESVTQDRNGSSKAARWAVEFIHDGSFIRLKSCFGKYLTASNTPFLLGMTGRKVLQTLPRRLDSSLEWEPIRDGSQVKLKTRYGHYLRANGGVPPWRNSVTHDIPHRTATQDWVLWEIDVLEIQVAQSPTTTTVKPAAEVVVDSEEPPSPSLKPSDSFVDPKYKTVEGRTIYYSIADEGGNVDDGIEGFSLIFKGNGVEELRKKLEEETGLEEIIVCSKSPLNGKLYPLRLQLPPNNATMHLVVVQSSSKAVARDFA